jgi:large subunit ribosomal protein L24
MAKTKARGGGAWKHITPLSEAAVVVEGLNIAKRHTKPRATGTSSERMPKVQQGGILEIAQPLALSKVMVVCSSCDKPTRIKHAALDNGDRVRVCRHCGERLEVKS